MTETVRSRLRSRFHFCCSRMSPTQSEDFVTDYKNVSRPARAHLAQTSNTACTLLKGCCVLHRLMIIVVTLGACNGFIDSDLSGGGAGDDGSGSDGKAAARKKFDETVMPLLTSNCMGCHVGDDGHGWMKAMPDAYTSIKAWPHLVEVSIPDSSTMLTHGQHQGPAWTVEQSATILSWIVLERDAQETTQGPETTAMDVTDGANTMPLDDAGATGAKLHVHRAAPAARSLSLQHRDHRRDRRRAPHASAVRHLDGHEAVPRSGRQSSIRSTWMSRRAWPRPSVAACCSCRTFRPARS